MRSALIGVLKAAVTVVLFYLLFRKVDFHEFVATLRAADVGLLSLAFLVLWFGHYICIFRWRMLMRPVMAAPSASRLFGIYCIGLFFNLTFPTVVGGDVVKAYYAGRPSGRFTPSFAATFLDRDAGMFAMMLIACTAVIIHPLRIPRLPVGFIIWSAFLAFTFINIAVFAPSLHRRLTSLLLRMRAGRLAAKVDAISDVFQLIGRQKTVLAVSLAISFVNQVMVMAVTWIMALALGIRVPLLQFFVVVPVVTLIAMIPVSLNGMGLREYAFVTLLVGLGADREASMALGILSSIFVFLSAVPGGIVYIFFRSRKDLARMAAAKIRLSS